MVNKKGFHNCCECSHLEIEIRAVRSQFESGLIDDADLDHQVKVLILRDMLNKYRNEFADAINKLTEDLENSIDLGEQQLDFRQRCFKEFESLMKGVNNPKPTDD